MKLVRYGAMGQEKPGLIDKSGQLRDLSGQVKDLDGRGLFAGLAGQARGPRRRLAPRRRRQAAVGAPVAGISKFIAIGLNYSDHAKETACRFRPNRSSS